MHLDIRHEIGEQRFVADVDGHTSYLSYVVIDDDTLDYRHTFVPEALRGRGIASMLVEHALRHAKDRHLKVVPTCPFVARAIERRPEFGDLVAA